MTAAFAGGIDVFGLSDVGLKRKNNEDHFIVASLRKAMDLRQTNLVDRSVFEAMRGVEAQLLAVAFFAWGLHHLDYPILRAQGAWTPWGYYLDICFELLVGAGLVLLVLDDLGRQM